MTEPLRIDFGQAAGDDAWRIEFKAPAGHRPVWIDNVSRTAALEVYGRWASSHPGELVSCLRCPPGPSQCVHDSPVWRFTEMTDMRITPMREAL